LDIGMGNPLGLLSTGVEAVQEIYGAYKTNDDDEFNTYITEPFLTSEESDKLINKLRDQGFFEAMAYDAQKGDWYLINPEDGTIPPGGEMVEEEKKEMEEETSTQPPSPLSPMSGGSKKKKKSENTRSPSSPSKKPGTKVTSLPSPSSKGDLELEQRIERLERELEEMRNNPPQACCVIS